MDNGGEIQVAGQRGPAASCALTPLGTLRPDRCHSLRGASRWNAGDVIGTTQRSPENEPNPTTMAGLTLLRLRSVNGIGSRTTSFLDQQIEDIVSRVVPHPHQRAL
jgi:hypothetical protein